MLVLQRRWPLQVAVFAAQRSMQEPARHLKKDLRPFLYGLTQSDLSRLYVFICWPKTATQEAPPPTATTPRECNKTVSAVAELAACIQKQSGHLKGLFGPLSNGVQTNRYFTGHCLACTPYPDPETATQEAPPLRAKTRRELQTRTAILSETNPMAVVPPVGRSHP